MTNIVGLPCPVKSNDWFNGSEIIGLTSPAPAGFLKSLFIYDNKLDALDTKKKRQNVLELTFLNKLFIL